jgi:hypothetical protein
MVLVSNRQFMAAHQISNSLTGTATLGPDLTPRVIHTSFLFHKKF